MTYDISFFLTHPENKFLNFNNYYLNKISLKIFEFKKFQIKKFQINSPMVEKIEKDLDYKNLNLIKNTDELDKHSLIITCKICLELVIDPLECSTCSTIFCKICISKCDKCPIKCNGRTFRKVKNRSTLSILEHLKVFCARCFKLLKYNQLLDHLTNLCGKLIVKCTNQECTAEVEKD
jgi:hypothetical protein